MNDFFKFIDEIKNNLQENLYRGQALRLEEDFFNLSSELWKDITNLETSDLSNLCNVHEYLIGEIIKIHTTENSHKNETLLSEHINLNNIKEELEPCKRAHGIYLFKGYKEDYFIAGDIHSDSCSLKAVLKTSDFFSKIINNENFKLIFLGDYVDRGMSHLKAIEIILLLKYLFPNHIFLLRGNHDGGKIEENCPSLCVGRNKGTTDRDYFVADLFNLSKLNKSFKLSTLEDYLKFFYSLCTVAFIIQEHSNTMLVHGGIPRPKDNGYNKYYEYIDTISTLTNEELKDHLNRSIVHNMLWSDPCDEIPESYVDRARFYFTRLHFDEFMNKIGCHRLIRGHEAESDGYKNFFDESLTTIFSAGIITDSDGNNINKESAYCIHNIKPKILNINPKSQIKIIEMQL